MAKKRKTSSTRRKSAAALRGGAAPRKAVRAANALGRDTWSVQDARAHLSDVINAAVSGRPQKITRSGKHIAVVVSAADYQSPDARRLPQSKLSLRDFFLNSPLSEVFGETGIPEVRHRERLRDIDLSDLDL